MIRNPYYLWLAALIALTAIGFGVAWYRCWIAPGDWVGWIQAVGSIEAIVAAGLIAQAQHWQERENKRQRDEEARKALVLELGPQMTMFGQWLRSPLATIDAILAHSEGSTLVVTVKQFMPAIPRALQSDSVQLLLLDPTIAFLAIQLRELLHSFCDRFGEAAESGKYFGIKGPNPVIPQELNAIILAIHSMKMMVDGIERDLVPQYTKIAEGYEQNFPEATNN